MNYSKRVDEVFGVTNYPHRTLRTVFDCDSNEWHNTEMLKKIEILEKIIQSGYSLENWIKDYSQYYTKINGKHVITSIPKSLEFLSKHIPNRDILNQITLFLNDPENKTMSEKTVLELVHHILNDGNFILEKPFQNNSFPLGSSIELSATKSNAGLTRQHIGATVIDAVLSAGVKYDSAVRPRIEKFREDFPKANTTSSFLNLLETNNLNEIINWNGAKTDRIIALTKFLKSNNIETEEEFRIWLKDEKNQLKIKSLSGIKDKTVNYLQILCGDKDVVSSTTHITNFIQFFSNWKPTSNQKMNDLAQEALIEKVAEVLNVDIATLDYSIWMYMSKSNNQKATKIQTGKEVQTMDISIKSSTNLADYCIQNLSFDKKEADEFFYSCLPLAVVDAVFSIGVRYEGVINVINNVVKILSIKNVLENKKEKPPVKEQLSVTEYLRKVETFTPEYLADNIYKNKQRTSSTNGILKAQAVTEFLTVLKKFNVDFFQDIENIEDKNQFEKEIKSIKGQASGVCLNYFYMLSGNEDLIKPDRMILRFLQAATGKEVTLDEAQKLLFDAAKEISVKLNKKVSAAYLDNMIWQYQRSL